MTTFVVLCAVIVAAVVSWVLLPLLRPRPPVDPQATQRERRIATVVASISLIAVAVGMYAKLSHWDFDAVQKDVAQKAEKTAKADALLGQLETKLKANPGDVTGWLLLGRSNVSIGRLARGAEAYQRAFDLTGGENIEAIVGLGESLALMDSDSLQDRAGQLFERALKLAPTHPKALWYGAMAALQTGDLRTGRDRLNSLLGQNPPEELRGILQRQVQDLDQQLNEGGQGATTQAESAKQPSPRSIRVAVSLAPELAARVQSPIPLFILARTEQAGGPPLAVQRHSSAEMPLTIELSERDAMLPSRTIATVPRVQVVARLSKTGSPQARSGDFYGEADYDFATASGTLQIVINQVVP